jgi:hypothetical protein
MAGHWVFYSWDVTSPRRRIFSGSRRGARSGGNWEGLLTTDLGCGTQALRRTAGEAREASTGDVGQQAVGSELPEEARHRGGGAGRLIGVGRATVVENTTEVGYLPLEALVPEPT